MDFEASLAQSLFLGNILEENLYPFPKIKKEEAETLKLVLESIDKFMSDENENYRKYDEKGAFPPEYIDALKKLGLFGLIIPEDFGGIGLSNLAYARVFAQTGFYDPATSVTLGAHSSIGMKGLLLFGNDSQKKKYLPKLSTGEMVAAFCLTEPSSGSDAASIQTKAVKQTDGSWILNGSKLWISNAGIAGFFTVFARTESAAGKMTAFILERHSDGISIGPKEDKMGIRASITTTVDFVNVRVPAENQLGEEGQGFKIAMAILNNGRTGLGGGCVGGMRKCIALSTKQAIERKQFGKSISEFTLVKSKIAQMTIDCFASESAMAMVAHYMDSGVKDYSVEAAMSKVFASESMWDAANEALQIAGGNGFMKEFPYERLVRDCRINLIFEGTNEILRLYIGLSGMKFAGSYLKDISNSAGKIFNDPIKGFGVLSTYATKKVSILTNIGGQKFSFVCDELTKEMDLFRKMGLEFSNTVESVLKKYGKNIVGSQLITKRVADIAIDLFVGLSVISRVSSIRKEKEAKNCEDELNIARMFTHQAKRRIRNNIRRIERNEDDLTVKLADSILEKGKYSWDIF
ncbi:MAG: acyl-CoA dehydrogenase family protein [bacterium]|nr:acyl-CoA dehydrogenase family protein [bacterium]